MKKVETVESVLMKTELAKSKLENLCREMQKSQKKAHDEHYEKLKTLEKNRQELIDQFKSSVANIQVKSFLQNIIWDVLRLLSTGYQH